MAATVWNRSVHRSPKSVPVPVPLRHNTLSGRSWVSLSGDSALALCSLAHGSHVFDGSLWHKSTHPKSSAFQIYWLLGSVVALLLTTRSCFSGSSCCSSDWLFRLSESNIFPDATILLIVTFSVMQFASPYSNENLVYLGGLILWEAAMYLVFLSPHFLPNYGQFS